MRQWNLKKLQQCILIDQTLYGFSVVMSHKRKWWNPMRFLFGRFKLLRIDPNEFYREYPKARDL